jgi:DNA-binding XRE family transcriptional regulator
MTRVGKIIKDARMKASLTQTKLAKERLLSQPYPVLS